MVDQEQAREIRRAKIRKKKRLRVLIIATAALIVVLLVLLVIGIVRAVKKHNAPPDVFTGQIGPYLPADPADIAAFTELPARYDYDYSQPVPAVEASSAVFDGALFLGDARLGSFGLYSMARNATIVSSGSASVTNALSLQSEDGTTVSALLESKEYKSVYLVLGMTELGWQYPATYIEAYGEIIDTVREKQPGAAIYIHLIVPVSSQKSGSPSYLTNARIAEYNMLLKQLAQSKEVFFLDAAEALGDETGALKSALTTDGVHFNKDGTSAWQEFLKTHYV